ncbi:M16 family metallopeptidase [Pseudopedobacter beijingensis]|uniref:M16 family metallopeptidase n=1 Tax=Pseudopedobacter beijingensis TaxID=1207056 RepID=A0ABW4IDQ8_9SPHI
MDHEVYTLKNGIRLLFKYANSPISHCCLLINTGSRDEKPGEPGLAHFIEHLLFKGTKTRNTNQILNRLEIVGADLNAYTTKEYTCLHSSFLNEYLERTIDLLADIAFNSVFPENEIEKEKGVIIDEILSYEDQPEEAIADEFENILFKGHTLGENILGTRESVLKFNKKDVLDFLEKNYNTSEIVLAVCGNYKFSRILKKAEKYLNHIPENTHKKQRIKPIQNQHFNIELAKPINQTHLIMGGTAYSFYDARKYGLSLLNNLLGGSFMSSRLNLEIREKRGIAYTIESNYIPLSDTGIFSIYFGTDAEKANKAIKLIHKELKKLRDQKLGLLQLEQAKKRFIGQIALSEENRMAVLISMAKSLVDFDYIDSLDEVFSKINNINTEGLLEISNEIFDINRLSNLSFVPEKE